VHRIGDAKLKQATAFSMGTPFERAMFVIAAAMAKGVSSCEPWESMVILAISERDLEPTGG